MDHQRHESKRSVGDGYVADPRSESGPQRSPHMVADEPQTHRGLSVRQTEQAGGSGGNRSRQLIRCSTGI